MKGEDIQWIFCRQISKVEAYLQTFRCEVNWKQVQQYSFAKRLDVRCRNFDFNVLVPGQSCTPLKKLSHPARVVAKITAEFVTERAARGALPHALFTDREGHVVAPWPRLYSGSPGRTWQLPQRQDGGSLASPQRHQRSWPSGMDIADAGIPEWQCRLQGAFLYRMDDNLARFFLFAPNLESIPHKMGGDPNACEQVTR